MRYFLQQQANEWESIKKNFPILKFSSSNRQCHHTFIRMQRTVVNMNANGYNGCTVYGSAHTHTSTPSHAKLWNYEKWKKKKTFYVLPNGMAFMVPVDALLLCLNHLNDDDEDDDDDENTPNTKAPPMQCNAAHHTQSQTNTTETILCWPKWKWNKLKTEKFVRQTFRLHSACARISIYDRSLGPGYACRW